MTAGDAVFAAVEAGPRSAYTHDMRIGFFGGSFDPVHLGHTALARDVRAKAELDEIRFLLARRPPHKPRRVLGGDHHRLAMLEAALRREDGMVVDSRELAREGPSYTVASMEEVRAEEPEARLFFLIGADNLEDLPRWRRFDDLARLVTFLVVARPSRPAPDPGLLAAVGAVHVPVTPRDVSSTDIRRRAKEGRSLEGLVDEEVARYIEENRLYRSEA